MNNHIHLLNLFHHRPHHNSPPTFADRTRTKTKKRIPGLGCRAIIFRFDATLILQYHWPSEAIYKTTTGDRIGSITWTESSVATEHNYVCSCKGFQLLRWQAAADVIIWSAPASQIHGVCSGLPQWPTCHFV